MKGKVVDKYSLDNGNIGMVIDDISAQKLYHVEFKDGYKGPSIDNLFGFLKDPFAAKTDPIDKLIKKGDFVELTLGYSKGPLRQVYKIHSVSGTPYNKKALDFPYKYFRLSRYKF